MAFLLRTPHTDRILTAPPTEPDVIAMNTISLIIKNDASLTHKAVQRIIERLQSRNEHDLLSTLHLLDECMGKCGTTFQSEVGKFRFLNEMIKLVSPRHAAHQTPKAVRDKVLDLLLIWTFQYPKEPKIKEAYDMLLKQGVDHAAAKSHRIERPVGQPDAAMMMPGRRPDIASHFDRIPKELLLSKDPRDTQAANLLIEKLVEEVHEREIIYIFNQFVLFLGRPG